MNWPHFHCRPLARLGHHRLLQLEAGPPLWARLSAAGGQAPTALNLLLQLFLGLFFELVAGVLSPKTGDPEDPRSETKQDPVVNESGC